MLNLYIPCILEINQNHSGLYSNMRFTHLFIFVLFSTLLGSCALFKPKCPIETCQVRMIHSHKDIYRHMDIDKVRKENLKRKKEWEKEHPGESFGGTTDSTDTEDDGGRGVQFTTRRHSIESMRSRNKKKKEETEASESATADAGTAEETEEEAKPEKKKKKKKRKKAKKKSRWFTKAHPVTNPKFLGIIPIKNTEKYGMGGEVKAKLWRSRVTPWWKNQNPKIGQQWKKPKEE